MYFQQSATPVIYFLAVTVRFYAVALRICQLKQGERLE